jgi:hypothetical protein
MSDLWTGQHALVCPRRNYLTPRMKISRESKIVHELFNISNSKFGQFGFRPEQPVREPQPFLWRVGFQEESNSACS